MVNPVFYHLVFVLILGIILGYAMIHEYRMYLENHWKARYSFCDFIKRERFYIYLFLGLTFVVILGITVYIMAMREQLSFGGYCRCIVVRFDRTHKSIYLYKKLLIQKQKI